MFPRDSCTAAAMVRHLLTDPVLPGELLPDGWPGAALREAYNDFAAELISRRDDRPTYGGDMTGGVRVEKSGPVTTVIMNRPEARNAVNGPAAAGLYAAFDEFDKDDCRSRRGAVGRQRNLLCRSRSQGVRHAGRQSRCTAPGPARWGRAGWCCPSR